MIFDYLNTGKKIILFNYDEEEYIEIRGTYVSLNELPFIKVQNIDELMEELKARGFRWEYMLEPQKKIFYDKI